MDKNETKIVAPSERDYNELERKVLSGQVPAIGIKLSEMYEFNVVNAKTENPLFDLVKTKPASRMSYIAVDHVVNSDLVIPVAINDRQKLDLPPGVTMIIGGSGSGKTYLTMDRMLPRNDHMCYTRFGEPLDRRLALILGTDAAKAAGVTLLQHEAQLAAQMARFFFTEEFDVMVIDSLRYLVYAGGGATGKGGVNMSLFADISFLDTVAALRGKALVVIVNPLTDDPDAYALLVEAARGSVAALIDVRSPTEIRYTSRFNADRDWQNHRLPANDRKVLAGAEEVLNVKTPMTIDLSKTFK